VRKKIKPSKNRLFYCNCYQFNLDVTLALASPRTAIQWSGQCVDKSPANFKRALSMLVKVVRHREGRMRVILRTRSSMETFP
jgi:hypothetical protein